MRGVHLLWTAIGILVSLVVLIFVAEISALIVQRFLLSSKFSVAFRASISELPESILNCAPSDLNINRCASAVKIIAQINSNPVAAISSSVYEFLLGDGNETPKSFIESQGSECQIRLTNGQTVDCTPIQWDIFQDFDIDTQAVANIKFLVALAGSLSTSSMTSQKAWFCSVNDDLEDRCFTCAALNNISSNGVFPMVVCRFALVPFLFQGIRDILYPNGGIQIQLNTIDLLEELHQ